MESSISENDRKRALVLGSLSLPFTINCGVILSFAANFGVGWRVLSDVVISLELLELTVDLVAPLSSDLFVLTNL